MNSTRTPGRHFLQIPGPTNVPDRILRAMDLPTMDHRGPAFGELGEKILAGLKSIFKCSGPVIIYPASGTGAWEAALVNTLSPGDRVLVPAGMPHAIGRGILLVELQEPTDFSVLLEWEGFAIDGRAEGHLGLGFDVALGCVDRAGWSD